MTDRQRRIEKLVQDVRAALDRGVAPERIHAELVRRRMPHDKAALVVHRVQAARGRVEPLSVAPPADAPTRARRRSVPFFVAIACTLLLAGFTGVLLDSREDAGRRAVERTARLSAEIDAARAHMTYLQERLDARRVDAEQIEWLRARVARGPGSFETPEDYAAMLARYERRRAAWNRTLPAFQVVSQALRTLATIHNAKLDSLGPHPEAHPQDAPAYVRIAAARGE